MADLHERLLAEIERYDGAMGTRTLVAVARAVVELHAPDEHGRCGACTKLAQQAGNHVRWRVTHPCATIQAIARELGVDHA